MHWTLNFMWRKILAVALIWFHGFKQEALSLLMNRKQNYQASFVKIQFFIPPLNQILHGWSYFRSKEHYKWCFFTTRCVASSLSLLDIIKCFDFFLFFPALWDIFNRFVCRQSIVDVLKIFTLEEWALEARCTFAGMKNVLSH